MYITSFSYLLTNSPKINYFTSCKVSSLTLKHRYLTFNFGMTNLRPHQLSINLCSNEEKLKVEKGRCKKHTTCGTSWILLGTICRINLWAIVVDNCGSRLCWFLHLHLCVIVSIFAPIYFVLVTMCQPSF
jgi:hypothetical protein